MFFLCWVAVDDKMTGPACFPYNPRLEMKGEQAPEQFNRNQKSCQSDRVDRLFTVSAFEVSLHGFFMQKSE